MCKESTMNDIDTDSICTPSHGHKHDQPYINAYACTCTCM